MPHIKTRNYTTNVILTLSLSLMSTLTRSLSTLAPLTNPFPSLKSLSISVECVQLRLDNIEQSLTELHKCLDAVASSIAVVLDHQRECDSLQQQLHASQIDSEGSTDEETMHLQRHEVSPHSHQQDGNMEEECEEKQKQ